MARHLPRNQTRAALGVLILALCACSPAPPNSEEPSGTAATSPSDPSSTRAPESQGAAMPADDAAWFRMHVAPGEGRSVDVGTLDRGRTATEPIPQELPVAAPMVGVAAGSVFFLTNTPDEGRLVAVDAASGESRVVMTTSDHAFAGTVNSEGSTAYILTADRVTTRLLRALAVDIASGETRQVADVRLHVTGAMGGFHLSTDGSVLAIDDCVERDCFLRLIDADTGAITSIHDSDAHSGLTDRFAVRRPFCEQGPCRRWLLDLTTREFLKEPAAAGTYHSHALVRGADGHVLVVGQLAGTPSWGDFPRPETEAPVFEIVDLTDVRVLGQIRPDLYALRIQQALDPSVGAELPPGWILVEGITDRDDERISFFAVDIATGRTLELAELGDYERP